ncbi:alpha/beta hydrolase [Puniceicoccaceae bacterium K14]|nr:alpha/beta hydrolase [Puniceicoccaceae bacterium K14]
MKEVILNSRGEVLDYSHSARGASQRKSDWLVILGHGVTGNKNRPLIVDTENALNKEGFDTLRFSFSGNGESGGRFEESTITKEVDDLKSVIGVARKHYDRICYIGHSMGAAVGVISAVQIEGIDCLVSLAGMVETRVFAQTEFGEIEPGNGVMWEEESCPLSKVFMDDLCEKIESTRPFVEEVTQPWLLVHGTADDVVLVDDTRSVLDTKGDGVSVVFVEGADHSFSEPKHKEEALSTVVNWIGKRA